MRDERNEEVRWRKQFGDRLKRLIHIKGMTQGQFATALGIDQSILSKYITGTYIPSGYRMLQIAKVLDCDISRLYDETF